MDLTGLDVGKLKGLAIEKWGSAPELWPVKVLSMTRTLELEHKLKGGKLDKIGGYFTCLRAIRFKTPAEMEDILGFQKGAFSSGVAVWKLNALPKPDEFELRGYTQTPGGETFDGVIMRRQGAARPEYFSRDGKAVAYPPGLAVEQWELRPGLLLAATQLARVPFGAKFTTFA